MKQYAVTSNECFSAARQDLRPSDVHYIRSREDAPAVMGDEGQKVMVAPKVAERWAIRRIRVRHVPSSAESMPIGAG